MWATAARREAPPEVGTGMMQRALIVHGPDDSRDVYFDNWQDVQDDIYRYAVAQVSDGILVRMVLREYLAAEVLWDDARMHTQLSAEQKAPESPSSAYREPQGNHPMEGEIGKWRRRCT